MPRLEPAHASDADCHRALLTLWVRSAPDIPTFDEAGLPGFDTGVACVLLHPYRALTDERGMAKIKVAKGRYRLFISGFNYIAYQDIMTPTGGRRQAGSRRKWRRDAHHARRQHVRAPLTKPH
jgi:hypothetical protein